MNGDRTTDCTDATDTKKCVRVRILQTLLLAGMLAAILLAHGCHGNEDHELLDVFIGSIK